MKKLVFFILGLVTIAAFTSCKKDSVKKEDKPDTPQSVIPDVLVGKWMVGEFNMKNFSSYNGTPDARMSDVAIAYSFTKDGKAEQFIYYKFDDGSGRQVLAYRKGTVTYDENKNILRFFSTQGNYRLFENGKKKQADYTAEYLYPGYAPQYYSIYLEQDSNKTIYLFCQNDDDEDLAFKKVNW